MIRRALPVALLLAAIAPAARADDARPPRAIGWFAATPFGRLDQAAARRGYQVYAQSCAACHSLNFLHYRDLAGIGLTPAEIGVLTAKITVPAGFDDQGKPATKPATPASVFAAPFPSEEAARAAMNGALPPDLSLIANALPGGADTVAALLTGYRDPPSGVKLADGMNYNLYFPGNQIAMPPPLAPGAVTYPDGTASSPEQNARDVAVFLTWAANPDSDRRKEIGFVAVGYFLAMAGITWLIQRRIWSRVG
jgi:ubiquinol-cytochrome c reductase cytochrome c1 subunit